MHTNLRDAFLQDSESHVPQIKIHTKNENAKKTKNKKKTKKQKQKKATTIKENGKYCVG